MNRTALLLAASLAAALSGCAQNAGPLFISGFGPPGPLCELTEKIDVNQIAGRLDVIAGGNNSFFMIAQFSAEGLVKVSSTNTITGDVEVRDQQFVLDEIAYSYESQPRIPGLRAEVVPIFFPLETSDAVDARVLFNIIGPDARTRLTDALIPDGVDQKRLTVRFEFSGRTLGSNARWSTGVSSFPITLVRSPDCAPGVTPAPILDFCGSTGQGGVATCP